MLKHYEDSKQYLTENPDLVCDDTANYLVVWCIDLEIEEVYFSFIYCLLVQQVLDIYKKQNRNMI